MITVATNIPKKREMMMKPLSPWGVYLFFGIASFIYIYPLIMANYLYWDDTYHALTGTAGWQGEGRVLSTYLYHFLSFSTGIPNLFPLSLILAVLCICSAMKMLTIHYYGQPTITQCLVVLPLWYTPFFLQALSYQFDCLTITLSISLAVFAVTINHRVLIYRIVISGLILAASLSFYQISINVFIGLVCIEVMRNIGSSRLLKMILTHMAQAFTGLLFYFISSYQLITNHRGGFSLDSVPLIGERLLLVFSKIELFFNPVTGGLFFLIAILSLIGFVYNSRKILLSSQASWLKVFSGIMYTSSLVILVFSFAGILLFMREMDVTLPGDISSRLLLGVSVFVVAIFYFTHEVLSRVYLKSTYLLALPLLSFLTFSYSYGNVMQERKDAQEYITQSIFRDIITIPEIYLASSIRILPPYEENSTRSHISTYTTILKSSAKQLFPALNYIMGLKDVVLLPESLVRLGINKATWNEGTPDKIKQNSVSPFVDRFFYKIYLINNVVYISFKNT